MKLRITVENQTFEVEVEIVEQAGGPAPVASRPKAATRSAAAPVAMPSSPAPAPAAGAGGNTFAAPIAGTIRAIKVKPGDQVSLDQEIMILEAMKMETSVNADKTGTIKTILVSVGDAVQSGQPLVEFA